MARSDTSCVKDLIGPEGVRRGAVCPCPACGADRGESADRSDRRTAAGAWPAAFRQERGAGAVDAKAAAAGMDRE
jgi:hypothetical protein